MRLLLLLTATLLVMGSFERPAYAEGPDTVDTKQGLTYTKPSSWVVASAKKGAVSALHASGDAQSQIEFRFAKITGKASVSYFNTFHSSLSKAKLQRVKDSEKKPMGKLLGTLTEYSTGAGDKQKSLFVYQFTTEKGAWLVVGMFDSNRRDKFLGDYEKLLASVRTE